MLQILLTWTNTDAQLTHTQLQCALLSRGDDSGYNYISAVSTTNHLHSTQAAWRMQQPDCVCVSLTLTVMFSLTACHKPLRLTDHILDCRTICTGKLTEMQTPTQTVKTTQKSHFRPTLSVYPNIQYLKV